MLHFVKKGGKIYMKAGLNDLYNLQGVKKMEILNISIGGFRNIRKLKIDFDSITALVGLNGYGKSNVMDAIDFAFDFIHCPSNIRVSMMSSKSGIPILKSNAGQNFLFDIEMKTLSNRNSYYVNYGFEFSWQTNNTPAKIINEYLNIKSDEKNQKYNSFIKRTGKVAHYRSSETGRCNKVIKIDDFGLVLSKLTSIDDLYYIDIINKVNSMQYFIERHLDASPSFAPDPIVIKGFQELELQGIQSIPRAIFYLKKDHRDKYELLVNSFRQLFPDVKGIEVQEFRLNQTNKIKISDDAPIMFTDSVYSMSIIDDKMVQPVSFESLSDGTKRIFLMLTFAIIADIKGLSLIAIEEPENSIHPGLLQNYIDILSQLIHDCKILITSHSPYMIQYLNPHSIYVGLSNNTGESEFGRIASTKVNALIRDAAEYDKSVGDYIFNILSANDSDEYLKDYLETNG